MLSGLSLPMLYSFLTIREETTDIASLAKDVLFEAREAVTDVNELIKKEA
jgi:mannose/fructose-specific phosphotransferase system component IIA